ENVVVAGHPVEQRHRLRDRPGEVVAHRPLRTRADGQWPAGLWVKVVAQPIEGVLVHDPMQPKPFRPLSAPGADQFLAFLVVISRRVIALGGVRAILLGDPQHARIISTETPDKSTLNCINLSDFPVSRCADAGRWAMPM